MPASPTASRSGPNLQNELHSATRAQHMTLNQSITARLPLCLPPHTSNAATYVKGMIVFGSIFLAFEEAWDTELRKKHDMSDNEMHRSILERLQTPGLRRSELLRHDLEILRSRLRLVSSQELDKVNTTSQAFAERIKAAISGRPYITLAYAWTMYLALFNGGRWLLTQLARPGPEFWGEDDLCQPDKIDALSFWRFDDSTQPNGEDIKVAFKTNFDSAATLLTDAERENIVAEGRAIFDLCAEMVDWLDHDQRQCQIKTGKVPQTGISEWFKPATRMWQMLSSAAAAYLAPSMPKPLREDLRPTE